MKTDRILIVAAHPDDEILGCFGTVAKMINEGAEAMTLILSKGITSRDSYSEKDIDDIEKQSIEANKIIGINKVILKNFPDQRFDSVDLLDIIKVIEQVKNEFRPDIIFTHFANDLNIDHCITNKAVLTATRPMVGETVKEIYAFEILSSTEWNYPLSFSPNYFQNIEKTFNLKIEAMKKYGGELREYPHPRSVEGITLNAKRWGMRIGNVEYAEAFQVLRIII